MDVPQRLEGQPWDGGGIDEFASCKAGLWDANIRPMIADRRGWTWFLGVPDVEGPSQREYEAMFALAKSGTNPEWAAFNWPSQDILPAEEIESMRRTMSQQMIDQELGGKFVRAGGLAFPDFSETAYPAGNVGAVAYDPALPLWWSLDFNIGKDAPACSIVGQTDNDGVVRVIHGLELQDARTQVACEAFLEQAALHGWGLRDLRIYGDASGAAKKTTGPSDWDIVRQVMRNHDPMYCLSRSNPRIRDTINAVNAKILAGDGVRRLIITPQAKRLIADLAQAPWPNDLADYHALAGLRYYVHKEYPVRFDAGEVEPNELVIGA